MTKTLTIEGMSCMHCVNRVKGALEAVAGVSHVDVSLEEKKATVEGERLKEDALKAAVEDAGYEVTGIQ